MAEGLLSQDELDALLGKEKSEANGGFPEVASLEVSLGDLFSSSEQETLKTVFDSLRVSGSQALSGLLGKSVTMGVPTISLVDRDRLSASFEGQVLEVDADYKNFPKESHRYYMREIEALELANAVIGEENEALDKVAVSALEEAFSQLSSSNATALGRNFKLDFSPSSPQGRVLNPSEIQLKSTEVIRVDFPLTINEVVNLKLTEIMSSPLAREFASGESSFSGASQRKTESRPQRQSSQFTEEAPSAPSPPSAEETPQVQSVIMPQFSSRTSQAKDEKIGLLMDVSMELTVELGRTKRQIRDILRMGAGTIIELDKLAGEPVDILVNRNLIAKGEVVVIDENFGVRVTEIISPLQRDRQPE